MPTLLWFRRDLRLSDHPALSSVDDAHLSKGERPDAYPAPIVDDGAERAEALRRYHSI